MRKSLRLQFIGADRSLGYRHGEVYELIVELRGNYGGPVIVRPVRCPYRSWESFWMNWTTA